MSYILLIYKIYLFNQDYNDRHTKPPKTTTKDKEQQPTRTHKRLFLICSAFFRSRSHHTPRRKTATHKKNNQRTQRYIYILFMLYTSLYLISNSPRTQPQHPKQAPRQPQQDTKSNTASNHTQILFISF